jgi:branched-chain amino acid transport system substrate-binding protein
VIGDIQMNLRVVVLTLFALFIAIAGYSLYYMIQPKDVKIGFIAGLSGKYSELGTEERNGFILAAEQINSEGGINGLPIRYTIEDDKQDKNAVVAAFSKLIGLEHKIIIGPATSSMASEVITLINTQTDLTVVSPTVSSQAFSNKDDNFIRLGNPQVENKISTIMEHILMHRPNAKNALMIYDTSNASYANKWSSNFKNTMDELGIVTNMLPVDGTSDFVPQLQAHINANAPYDIIGMALNGKSTANVAQRLQLSKLDVLKFVGGWALTSDLMKDGGSAIEGLNVLTPYNPLSKAERFLHFKQSYTKRFGKEPGSFATRAYDALFIIKDALHKNPNISHLKESIVKVGTFEGLQSMWNFNKFGDPVGMSDQLLSIEGGEFVPANAQR